MLTKLGRLPSFGGALLLLAAACSSDGSGPPLPDAANEGAHEQRDGDPQRGDDRGGDPADASRVPAESDARMSTLDASIAADAAGPLGPGADATSPDGAVGDTAGGEVGPSAGARLGCLLLLGDSITQAAAGHLGYRYWLWSQLKSQFPPLRFVGSQTMPYGGTTNYPDPKFDRHHEGHWGWRADQLLSNLPGWLASYKPGFVIMHVGSNDAFMGQTPDSTISEIGKIVDLLRQKNARVAILLAKLIPTTYGGNAGVMALNAKLPAFVSQKTSAASPILLVDQNTGFDPAKETYDGVHPNEAGEKKMATRWASALAPLLAGGVEACP